MRKLLIIVIGMIFLFSVSILSAKANSIIYYPTDDAFVNQYASDGNFGNYSNELQLSDYPGYFRRIYLKFDLSNLSGMTITSATLYLHVYAGSIEGEDYINLHRVTESDWDEETLTWNNQPDDGLVYITKTYIDSGGWKTWSGLENLVQGWVDGDYPNYGIVLECDLDGVSNELIYVYFDDKSTDNPPYLEVEAVPVPSAVFLFGSGLIGLAVIRRKKFRKI